MPSQATTYTEAANRKKLASDDTKLLGGANSEHRDCRTRLSHRLETPICQRFPSVAGRSGGTRTPNPRFWRPVL